MVPIVTPRNPVRGPGTPQLRKIFGGAVTNWREVRGEDRPVEPVFRDAASGTAAVWEKAVTGPPPGCGGREPAASGSAVLARVAEAPGAIGYISAGYLNREIRPLRLDGFAPAAANVRRGTWPVYRRLFLYVTEERLTAPVKRFIAYLPSAEGQASVEASGLVPAHRGASAASPPAPP